MNPRVKLILAAVGLIALLAAARVFHWQDSVRDMLQWISGLGAWGPVLFIALYIGACVLLVPGSVLTLGAGVVFGVVRGTVIVSVAATLGATAAFLLGRYFARSWVTHQLEHYPRFQAIDEAVAREGWKIVGLTRLSPLFPFNLLNYAFGVTRVTLRDYVLASWAGMLPATAMYVYVGSVIGDLGKLGNAGRTRTTTEWTLYMIGLLATVIVTIFITRVARAALEKKITL